MPKKVLNTETDGPGKGAAGCVRIAAVAVLGLQKLGATYRDRTAKGEKKSAHRHS